MLRSVFGIDPRALVSLRIGLAGFLMLDLLLRALHLRALYSDAGVMPRTLVDPFYREVFRHGAPPAPPCRPAGASEPVPRAARARRAICRGESGG